ncbi:glutamate synthase subunit beta [Candidatus Margulisiibacteriota bacterium]
MGNPKGFLEIKRQASGYRPVKERLKDFAELEKRLSTEERILQASRCMDCGVPFCNWACPLGNVMPQWQNLIYQGRWKEAISILHATNNLPEITGRVCPALCEASCVLSIDDEAVTIRENELAAIEYAFENGYIKPQLPPFRTGKKVAVIGSGPAGLACADQLNKMGHSVVIFEKDAKAGGLLRYGIPDFKLDKNIIDRRLNIYRKEGIEIQTNTIVGQDISADYLKKSFDAVCLTTGAGQPRDLAVNGRDLQGVHFAMEYLTPQNTDNELKAESSKLKDHASPPQILRSAAQNDVPANQPPTTNHQPLSTEISAKNKHVLIIGGGDTGSDCVGTANRQGAKSVTQIEILPQPPEARTEDMPWPVWPTLYKSSSSHQEGCERMWGVATKELLGKDGIVKTASLSKVEWSSPDSSVQRQMSKVSGSDFELKADLVLLAMGFVHPVHEGLLDDLNIEYDQRGNVQNNNYKTNIPGVFTAGDTTRGASLVVWAILSGREAAVAINIFFEGRT